MGPEPIMAEGIFKVDSPEKARTMKHVFLKREGDEEEKEEEK